MRQSIAIIGSGLGGCYLAEGLIEHFNVTMIDISNQQPLLRDRLFDVARPAVTYPNIESGFGGTSKVWHNALMEIEESIFDRRWPFSKEVIIPYYEQAYLALAGIARVEILKYANSLRDSLIELGLPAQLLSQSMFIPRLRINAWNALGLQEKVKRIEGETTELICNELGKIIEIKILKSDGGYEYLSADYFVLAAGGLGTPLLLQKLAKSYPFLGIKHAGLNYEDHPMAFIGEIELKCPLYKLWNFPIRAGSGKANIRIPLSLHFNQLNISFQMRPAHHWRLSKPREKIISVLNDLRNFPLKINNYWRLLSQMDDLFEILSFKFGLRFPTRKYSILIVAEQPPSSNCSVWRDSDCKSKIFRQWDIDTIYISNLKDAITVFLSTISALTNNVTIFDEWDDNIFSSSHHSGTARMSKNPEEGVCDENGKVYGVTNLFICDGSLIPGSGFVNTGLTIVALAKRMRDYFLKVVLR